MGSSINNNNNATTILSSRLLTKTKSNEALHLINLEESFVLQCIQDAQHCTSTMRTD